MHTQMSKTFENVTDEKLATLSRSRWYQIGAITYWIFTVLLVVRVIERVSQVVKLNAHQTTSRR